jgi:hypothetical protein
MACRIRLGSVILLTAYTGSSLSQYLILIEINSLRFQLYVESIFKRFYSHLLQPIQGVVNIVPIFETGLNCMLS